MVFGIIDHEQLTVVDLHPVYQTGIVGCLGPTPAAGLNLDLDALVGHLQEALGSLEQQALE